MRFYFLILYLLVSIYSVGQCQEKPEPNSNRHYLQKTISNRYYFGTNPLAYLAAFQLQDNFKRYIPEVSGLEYGISAVGGYFLSPKQILETRVSVGNIHQISRVGQLHLGSNYLMFKNHSNWYRNFYFGGFFKLWDYYNRLTKIHFYNIAPYVAAGYMFEIKPFLLDVRLNQSVAIYSWSSLEHSSAGSDWFLSPWPEFLPVMPSLSISICWLF